MPKVEVSVIISTRDRAALLEYCLICLCQQTIDPARYNICVVDNGSSDHTQDIVKKVAARFPTHQLFALFEPLPGVCRAHNRGIAATESDYLVFPDDDVRVPPNWLESFLIHFETKDEKLAIIGGEIVPIWKGKKPDWITEGMLVFLSATTNLGHLPRYVGFEEYFIECNCCYRRKDLAEIGNFPEYLGRSGNSLLCGQNVVESGIKQRGGLALYDPNIIVRHIIHADRLTPTWFRRRFFWQGVTGQAVRVYQARQGMVEVGDEPFKLNLPLKLEDWAFVNQETAEGLDISLHYFQSLGFVLALTGVMPVGEAL
jgi:glycosyltransferase involved in cell wall biosynthesis